MSSLLLKVALIGRPNVGKSTLFNRLTGRKLALVHEKPGMTRDRRYGSADLFGLKFSVIDTAGLADPHTGEDHADLLKAMYRQTQFAIDDADVLFFMIDGQQSLTPYDIELAQLLRKTHKPICVLANKTEGQHIFEGVVDAPRLGLNPIFSISAEHGQGMDDLFDFLKPFVSDHKKATKDVATNAKKNESVERFENSQHAMNDAASKDLEKDEDEDDHANRPLRLAIMGRPNVGKSTLVNAFLGEERQLTGDLPGLTRDAIRLEWTYKNRNIQLIDTAGIRRNSRVDESTEKLSVIDAKKALQYAEGVILVLDATQALEKQDLTLAYDIYNEGRAMVIALNKWDLVKDKSAFLKNIQHKLTHQLAQAKEIPFIGVSATKKQGLKDLMEAVLLMDVMWNKRVPTARLNTWLREVVSHHPAPAINGRRIRPKYITQAKSRPPTFVLFCSQAEKLPESYTRYLSNSLRVHFDIQGVPIRFWVRSQKNPYDEKK